MGTKWGTKSVWFSRGTKAIIDDYRLVTKQSFSRTVGIIVDIFTRRGMEDVYKQELVIQKYIEIIKGLHKEIAGLRMQVMFKEMEVEP